MKTLQLKRASKDTGEKKNGPKQVYRIRLRRGQEENWLEVERKPGESPLRTVWRAFLNHAHPDAGRSRWYLIDDSPTET